MTHFVQLARDTLPLTETFQFEGQSVRYGVMGEGPPLVFLHGTPFSSQVWRRIAPIVARFRRVHYFDLLGYGASEQRAGQDVSLGVQNRLFAALLDHCGLRRPDVVAHDFGGATALRAAVLDRRAYRTLLLIDPVALTPSGSPFVRHARSHEQAFAQAPAYIHAAMLEAYLQGAAHRPMSPDVLRIYASPWQGERGQAAFYRQIAQMDDCYTDEVQNRYGEIDCPVSILWGQEDRWISYERGVELATRIPGAQLTCITGAGHLVQEDAPEVIVGALMELVQRRLPEGQASDSAHTRH